MVVGKAFCEAPVPPFLLDGGLVNGVFQYRRGRAVYIQGDPADGMFYVMNGRLILSVVSPEGKEAIVEITDSGEFLGEDCLSDPAVRCCSAVALDDTTLVRIEKTEVRYLFRSSPDFADGMLRHTLRRNARLRENLTDLYFRSSEHRLARALLALTDEEECGEPESMPVPRVSQTTLAAMVGTTRSRVSYFLGKFRRMGMIRHDHGMRVNRPKLAAVLDHGARRPVLPEELL